MGFSDYPLPVKVDKLAMLQISSILLQVVFVGHVTLTLQVIAFPLHLIFQHLKQTSPFQISPP